MDRIVIKFDAACRNVVGENCPMGLGVAVFINDEYREDLSIAQYFETKEILGTSNVGEWNALIQALIVAQQLRKHYPKEKIKVFGDSQLIVNQFNLLWRIKEKNFEPFFKRAKQLNLGAKVGEIYWIPREQNTHADDLSKLGLHGEKGNKNYYIKGIHDESDSSWIEFESDSLKELKKYWWDVEVKDQEHYEMWDRKNNKEIFFNK